MGGAYEDASQHETQTNVLRLCPSETSGFQIQTTRKDGDVMNHNTIIGLAGSVLAASQLAIGSEIAVVGWNAEANFNGANPTAIAERMAFITDCDLWGFAEVNRGIPYRPSTGDSPGTSDDFVKEPIDLL